MSDVRNATCDTPRTDAAVSKGIIYRDGWRATDAHRDSEWVPAEVAREMERELRRLSSAARATEEVTVIDPRVMDLVREHGATMTSTAKSSPTSRSWSKR